MDTASSLLSLTFSIQKPCAVAPGSRTQAQYIYYSLSGWGCRDSKLGFQIWGEARPGYMNCRGFFGLLFSSLSGLFIPRVLDT